MNLIQKLKNPYSPLLILWPSSSTSSRTSLGPTNQPILLEVLATFLSDRAALKGRTPDRKKLVTIICTAI